MTTETNGITEPIDEIEFRTMHASFSE